MTEETEPLNSPPMSMHTAQETATVSSRPPRATVRQKSAAISWLASTPGSRATAAIRKPERETMIRPRRKSPHLEANRSDNMPPAMFVAVGTNNGRLARPALRPAKGPASPKYVGKQAKENPKTKP